MRSRVVACARSSRMSPSDRVCRALESWRFPASVVGRRAGCGACRAVCARYRKPSRKRRPMIRVYPSNDNECRGSSGTRNSSFHALYIIYLLSLLHETTRRSPARPLAREGHAISGPIASTVAAPAAGASHRNRQPARASHSPANSRLPHASAHHLPREVPMCAIQMNVSVASHAPLAFHTTLRRRRNRPTRRRPPRPLQQTRRMAAKAR